MTKVNHWNEYHIARTLEETLNLMGKYGERARLIAGGTDLILGIHEGRIDSVDALIDISRVPELKGINVENGWVTIGAGVTLSELAASKELRSSLPILPQAAGLIAGRQIRNVATIGGNVVNASPAADMTPALLVLDAVIVITGTSGNQRELPLQQFLRGVRKVDLRSGELVLAFRIPAVKPDAILRFRKVQPRKAMAISIVNMALHAELVSGCLSDLRLALGAVAPVVVRLHTLEAMLNGMNCSDFKQADLFSALKTDISPISDFRGSKGYREKVASRILAAELAAIWNGDAQ